MKEMNGTEIKGIEIKGAIDLHMHSYYSEDGEFSPEELVLRCREAGIGVMAVSDHNCTKANREAERAARDNGILYVPAIEIDCTFEGVNLHLLGYEIDAESREFEKIEENVAAQNIEASRVRLERIRELGFSVTEEELDRAAGNGYWKHVWPGELFAEVLLSKQEYKEHGLLRPYRPGGSRGDNPYVNFYWDFCSQGKPCHAPVIYPDLEETVETVHGGGGKAVLAHPGNNLKGNMELLDPIVNTGIDGIEAFCSYHGEEERKFFMEYGRKRNLILTCGSDYHGKTKPAVALGGHGCILGREEMEENLHRLLGR